MHEKDIRGNRLADIHKGGVSVASDLTSILNKAQSSHHNGGANRGTTGSKYMADRYERTQ